MWIFEWSVSHNKGIVNAQDVFHEMNTRDVNGWTKNRTAVIFQFFLLICTHFFNNVGNLSISSLKFCFENPIEDAGFTSTDFSNYGDILPFLLRLVDLSFQWLNVLNVFNKGLVDYLIHVFFGGSFLSFLLHFLQYFTLLLD